MAKEKASGSKTNKVSNKNKEKEKNELLKKKNDKNVVFFDKNKSKEEANEAKLKVKLALERRKMAETRRKEIEEKRINDEIEKKKREEEEKKRILDSFDRFGEEVKNYCTKDQFDKWLKVIKENQELYSNRCSNLSSKLKGRSGKEIWIAKNQDFLNSKAFRDNLQRIKDGESTLEDYEKDDGFVNLEDIENLDELEGLDGFSDSDEKCSGDSNGFANVNTYGDDHEHEEDEN